MGLVVTLRPGSYGQVCGGTRITRHGFLIHQMDRPGDFGHGVCDLLHGVIIVVREEPEACGLPLDSALPVFEPARRVGTFPRPLRPIKNSSGLFPTRATPIAG